MPYQTLALDSRPPLLIISLIRAASGNRIDRPLVGELREALQDAGEDRSIRAVVLTGSEGVFCLGWDAATVAEIERDGVSSVESGLLGSTFQFLAESPLPVIAAINGDAFSAGLELALACDLRLATTEASLGLPDTSDGRIPMAGGTQRLARIAGRSRAIEMVLTGRIISAGEALTYEILNMSCEPGSLLDAAVQLGTAIATRGPLAVRLAKEAVHRGLDMPLQQAMRYETDLTVLLQTTADRTEGVHAFLEKRRPRFEGR